MADGATFESFQRELARLVEIFAKNLAAYKSGGYDEASLRQEFLNPLFRVLGCARPGRTRSGRRCKTPSAPPTSKLTRWSMSFTP